MLIIHDDIFLKVASISMLLLLSLMTYKDDFCEKLKTINMLDIGFVKKISFTSENVH